MTENMNQVKQKFRTQNISNTMAHSMSQHHLLLLCRYQGSKRHLDSLQSLRKPEAVVSEFLFQIQCLIQSFNISALLTFWGRIILRCEGRPVHCRMFSSSPGLCPFDARSTSSCNNQKCLKTFPNVPWVASYHSWEGRSLKAIFCCCNRTFLLTSHFPEFSYVAIPNCKGGWVTWYLF